MREFWLLTALFLLFSLSPLPLSAQQSWTPEQGQVLDAIERLSATTAPGGGGADAYGRVLAEEFSRWTIGSKVINDKESWVGGMREWFDAGWRVSDREVETLEIHLRGDVAYTRRIVKETYLGPDNDTSVSSAALAEVWIRGEDGWLLLRVNVHPLDT